MRGPHHVDIIRVLDPSKDEVQTLVGGDLFDFGDVDAVGNDVRLQHPLGLLWLHNKLLIADTYNHKIKELDPQARRVTSLFGNGKPGQSDGKSPSFYEPAGLTAANGKLYVADTNNHAIRVIDLKTKQTSTLRINGLMPPAKSMERSSSPSTTRIRSTLLSSFSAVRERRTVVRREMITR